jgi:hypothetical protein
MKPMEEYFSTSQHCTHHPLKRINTCKKLAKAAGVLDKITVFGCDLLDADLSDATVVTMYLSLRLNNLVMPLLSKLREGSRIVTRYFPLEGYRPDRVVRMDGENLYLYSIPLQKALANS